MTRTNLLSGIGVVDAKVTGAATVAGNAGELRLDMAVYYEEVEVGPDAGKTPVGRQSMIITYEKIDPSGPDIWSNWEERIKGHAA